MTLTHIHRTHYIYEVDNIPDHRSRRFGCCPCLLAVRASDSFANKKNRGERWHVRHGRCKTNQRISKLVLLLYHSMQP